MPRKTAEPPVNPILIGDLPVAEEAALAAFERLPGNIYRNVNTGKAYGNDEGTSCDCHFVPGRSKSNEACGEGSNCINRLTLVECIEGDCPSRAYCQNRRFQSKEYAEVRVVQTEKKGFGLRAESQIPRDAFIYEYIGEVVKEAEFIKRMARYAQEGVKHFYFMMLQKEEYIDATRRGDVGRFANHSCNPNCYVSKWVVGNRVRMGIFAKRTIMKHEELTFNYNVDRYGHDAQECFCGEPNCVGYIGGKTQTDIGGMDDLYIEALGITEDVEKYSLKGTRRKKGKKLDEDYLPPLVPMAEDDVPLVLQALRQASSSNIKMLPHLLTRLELTADQDVLRSVMRFRGFSLMHSLLESHQEDLRIVKLILGSLKNWPLMNRNKVEDSKIEEPVKQIAEGDCAECPAVLTLAQELLAWWYGLETAYRIPRRAMQLEEVDGQPLRLVPVTERPPKRLRTPDDDAGDAPKFKYTAMPATAPTPGSDKVSTPITTVANVRPAGPSKEELAAIVARATEVAEAARVAEAKATADAAEAEEKKRLTKQRRKERAERKEKEHNRQKEKSANSDKPSRSDAVKVVDKEKRLVKLVGEVVVKYMSHYKDQMSHDVFKKHAKELTHLITEKEKKSSSYKDGKLTSLSDEKRKKMKKFVIDYVKKLLDRRARSSSAALSGPKGLVTGNGDTTVPVSGLQTPGASGRPTKSPLEAEDGDGGALRGGSEDSDTGDNDGGRLSPAASDGQDAMSVDGDTDADDAKSDVTVETPPRPPELE